MMGIPFWWNYSIFLRINFPANSNIYLTNINKRAQCQWNRHYDWIAKKKKSYVPCFDIASTYEHWAHPIVNGVSFESSIAPLLEILSIYAAHSRRAVPRYSHLKCSAVCQFMQSHQFSLCSLWSWWRRIVRFSWRSIAVAVAGPMSSLGCGKNIAINKFESNWYICNQRLSCNFLSKLLYFFLFFIYPTLTNFRAFICPFAIQLRCGYAAAMKTHRNWIFRINRIPDI